MYWIAYYYDKSYRIAKKRFDTQAELDAWIKNQERTDDDGQTSWKPADQGGCIHELQDVYAVRQGSDLEGTEVTLYTTPVPKNPVGVYRITSVEYVADPSGRKQANLTYSLKGIPVTDKATEAEPAELLQMSEACLKAALLDPIYGFAEFNKPWALPCIPTDAVPEGKFVIMRPSWQTEKIRQDDERLHKEWTLREIAAKFKPKTVAISLTESEENGKAFTVSVFFLGEKAVFSIPYDLSGESLAAMRSRLETAQENTRKLLLLETTARKDKTPAKEYTTPSLFPELEMTNQTSAR